VKKVSPKNTSPSPKVTPKSPRKSKEAYGNKCCDENHHKMEIKVSVEEKV
jgi:hypothetical protein